MIGGQKVWQPGCGCIGCDLARREPCPECGHPRGVHALNRFEEACTEPECWCGRSNLAPVKVNVEPEVMAVAILADGCPGCGGKTACWCDADLPAAPLGNEERA